MASDWPDGFQAPAWCVASPEPIGWGIVGPGVIARVFAGALERSGAGRVERVFSRSRDRAEAFASEHSGEWAETLDELVGDDAVQAVYVATPHPMHAPAVEAGLRAGKAVLCEKPLTIEPAETERLVGLAGACGVALVEAWMYRTHPQIARVEQLIREGAIGRVRAVRSVFGVPNPKGPPERLLNPELGGGVIYDIGGYPLTLAMLAARAQAGSDCCPPRLVSARGEASALGVDVHAEGEFVFETGSGDCRAHLAVSLTSRLGVTGVIEGERGTIELPNPFLPEGRRDGTLGELVVSADGERRAESLPSPHDCFALEAIAVGGLIVHGKPEPVGAMVNHAETLALARAMSEWRAGVLDSAAV
ncbi:MAG: Gfo/Idh/MocA family protein [Phycisphaerales bacterium JB040]